MDRKRLILYYERQYYLHWPLFLSSQKSFYVKDNAVSLKQYWGSIYYLGANFSSSVCGHSWFFDYSWKKDLNLLYVLGFKLVLFIRSSFLALIQCWKPNWVSWDSWNKTEDWMWILLIIIIQNMTCTKLYELFL